jgi:hypothetical protein
METLYLHNLSDDDLYGVMNLWAGSSANGSYAPGSPEEAAAHCALYLRVRYSCQPSGVVVTMQERAQSFEQEHPELAAAYRKFVKELQEWHEVSNKE